MINYTKLINHAFLYSLPIEVWQDGERIGAGRIVRHTRVAVQLDDGDFYMKANCSFIIKS